MENYFQVLHLRSLFETLSCFCCVVVADVGMYSDCFDVEVQLAGLSVGRSLGWLVNASNG